MYTCMYVYAVWMYVYVVYVCVYVSVPVYIDTPDR